MIKYKSLPLYETCTLNYEIRRNKNPIKINEYRDACHINRSVMHAGNLWDSIKKGFNKVKNVFKKGMDFIDNNEVTKSLKDSALNYLGQKTGVDMNKIYDTAHKVIDVIPDVQETNPDPYNYNQYPNSYNYNSNYTYPYSNTTGYNNAYNYTPGYNTTSTYNYTPATTNYTNTTGYNNATANAYNYTPSTPSQNNSSLQNQFTNTYNQIMKQPLTAPQKQTVQSNFNRFSMGLKSCGMVDVNRFLKNKTFMRNIPKMLMMASGSRSVSKDFLPVLQKFGIKTLPMPKTLIPMIDKLHGPLNLKMVKNAVKARQGRGEESDEKIVKSETVEDKPVKEKIAKAEEEESKVEEKSNGRLYLGRGKSSKYQDILNKLKSSKK